MDNVVTDGGSVNASVEEIAAFADRMGSRGVYNPTTARLRVGALRRITKVLGDDEPSSAQALLDNLEGLVNRLARTSGGENPDTLPFVEQLSGPNQFRDLVRLLGARGYPAAHIEKIMGLNFVRYAREIWGG